MFKRILLFLFIFVNVVNAETVIDCDDYARSVGSNRVGSVLADIASAVGANETLLVLDGGSWAISTNRTFATNISWRINPRASFVVATNQTLTINGTVYSDTATAFASGDGTHTQNGAWLYPGALGNTNNLVVTSITAGTGTFDTVIAGDAIFDTLTVNTVDLTPQLSTNISWANTDTTDEVQAKIDALGKYIPFGETVQILIDDGTHTMTNNVEFADFTGGGSIVVKATNAEPNTIHSNQAAILDFTNPADNYSMSGLQFLRCDTRISVQKLRIDTAITTDGTNLHWSAADEYNAPITFIQCYKFTEVLGCRLSNNTITAGSCVMWSCSHAGDIQGTYVDTAKYGVNAEASALLHVQGTTNMVAASLEYGLVASDGGIVAKDGVILPTGNSGTELSNGGGVIR